MKPFPILTQADRGANAAAAAKGHRIQRDYRPGADGWACVACGMSVRLEGGEYVGPAAEQDCPPEAIDAHLPDLKQIVEVPSGPFDFEVLRRLRPDVMTMALNEGTAAETDSKANVQPWDTAVDATLAGIAAGAFMFQRFVCDNCRAIQTMPTANHIYAIGRCEECAHLTDLRVAGFATIGLAAPPGTDAGYIERLVAEATAGLKAVPDNFIRRHRGETVKSTPHRAPCRNCGQAFHPGKPCQITARAAFRRGRR